MEANTPPQLQKDMVDYRRGKYTSTAGHASDARQFHIIDRTGTAEVGPFATLGKISLLEAPWDKVWVGADAPIP